MSAEKKCIRDYAGNYIYENDVLQFFNHAEGYVTPDNNGGYEYVYQYKDHLGNIRLSYSDNNGDGSINASTEIIEENNYYPFGLKHKGYNDAVSALTNSVASKFKYNGVELEESLGLDLYEMDFRQYDPTIARFTAVDPVTHHSMSTYTGFDNNPVFWADPSGADGEHYSWENKRYENDEGNEVSFSEAMASQGLNTDGSKNKESPDDIIFQNKDGKEIGRIVLPGEDQYVTIDTDNVPPSPIVVDPLKDAKDNLKPDATGISFEYSGVVGGGMLFGIDAVYFLSGSSAGKLYLYRKYAGAVGLDGEIGGSGFVSYFNPEANVNFMNAQGFEGNFSAFSGGFYVSGSYTWSNEKNVRELYPGMKSRTTWESYGVGGSPIGGEIGAKVYWGKSILMNSGNPIK